jgi:hypothetical protein
MIIQSNKIKFDFNVSLFFCGKQLLRFDNMPKDSSKITGDVIKMTKLELKIAMSSPKTSNKTMVYLGLLLLVSILQCVELRVGLLNIRVAL